MRLIPGIVVACALIVGCNPPGPAPACAPCPACPSASAATAPLGEPPFAPATSLKAHQRVTWQLQVSFDSFEGIPPGRDYMGMTRIWEIAETRAGDVPMPPGSPWKCRFDHVDVRATLLMRAIQCSADGWRTRAGDTANAPNGGTLVGASVELYGDHGANWNVQLVPCAGGCMAAPELP